MIIVGSILPSEPAGANTSADMRVPSLRMSAARKVTPSGTRTLAFFSCANAPIEIRARGTRTEAIVNSRMKGIGIPRGCGRYLSIRSLLVSPSDPVNLVLTGEAEAADTAGVLFGEKAFVVGGSPERVSPANVNPAPRQRGAGEHRAEVAFLQYFARDRVKGDELAAADGSEIRHPVAHRDPGANDIAHVAVHRLARRPAHLGDLGPLVSPALGYKVSRRRGDAAPRRNLTRRRRHRLSTEPNG